MSDDMTILILVILFAPIALAVIIGLVAWPVMLMIGAASATSAGLVPALGYWTTFWLTGALVLVTARPLGK